MLQHHTSRLPLPEDVPGLSSAHILSADEPGVSITSHTGGRLTKISFPRGKKPQSGGGKRSAVTEFSRKSRRDLLNFFNSLNQNKIKNLPLFITLTYPAQFPTDKETWTEHFNRRWRRRFERRYGRLGMVWRKEFQKRGAPHFHVLVFTDRSPSEMYEFVSRAWYESCGEISPEHLRAGTRVERVRSWGGVMAYAAKYMGKLETLAPGVESPGRFWGKWNVEELPVDPHEETISYDQAVPLRRVLRKYTGQKLPKRTLHLRSLNLTAYVSDSTTRRLMDWLRYYAE